MRTCLCKLRRVNLTAVDPELRVFDVSEFPYQWNSVNVEDCEVGEDVSFSQAQGKWYLTCMGSSVVIVGDSETDEVLETVAMPAPWPRGIATNDAIDRKLVTSTANRLEMPFRAPDAGPE